MRIRRSPQGERGLKFGFLAGIVPIGMSLSARRAWIEIFDLTDETVDALVALRKESVD